MWQDAVKRCIHNAVQTIKRSNTKFIDIVLSPDVDGVLSSLFISQYAGQMGWKVHVIGTYNGRSLRAFGNIDSARVAKALWVDLDVRFNVRSVGQHFLGSTAVHAGTFNPNVFYSVQSMKNKYPFSTSALLFWALCPGFALSPLGEAALVHADSMYWVATRYRKNAGEWCTRLFPNETPPLLQSLLDESYLKTRLATHQEFVSGISKWTFATKKRDFSHVANAAIDQEGWRDTMGKQTCRILNNAHHTLCVNTLVQHLSGVLNIPTPVLFDPSHTNLVWRGTKMLVEPSPYTEDLEAYLQQHNIRSHAITSSRCISVTEGPPLHVLPPQGTVEFF